MPSVPSRLPWDQFWGASMNLCRLLQHGGQAGLAPQLFVEMASLQMFVTWFVKVQLSTATVIFKNKKDAGNQNALSKSKAQPEQWVPPQSPLCWLEMPHRRVTDVLLLSAFLKSPSTGTGAHYRNHSRGFEPGGCSCPYRSFNDVWLPMWIKTTGGGWSVMLWPPSGGGEGHFWLLLFERKFTPKS